MLKQLKKLIKKNFAFEPNRNQLLILRRLIFEITKKENISVQKVLSYLKVRSDTDKYSGNIKFFALRKALLKKRFPLTFKKDELKDKKIFLNDLRPVVKNNWRITPVREKVTAWENKEFKPSGIFVEKEVIKSELVRKFKNKFPRVRIKEIESYGNYTKNNKFNLSQLKKPLIFIIKEKWDFLKVCPCTKGHLHCGYWILNLGFGCPFDCSYCFLQQYTNSQGIILPANIEDFFKEFDKFYKKLQKPIRIGSGEFCDSLALDHITGYSKKLIPYFKNKKVLFELKTKSASIANLLKIEPAPNIIISWSLNPSSIVRKEEIGTASLTNRLKAAQEVQRAGYKLGFHFDPIIYSKNWEKLYEKVITDLYSKVKPPFAWISLGTLRCNRRLKTIHEMRFSKSTIFYEELFLGEDKKLRYPEFLRKEIYQKITSLIRKFDKKTPIYLCMEDKNVWDSLNKNLTSPSKIEKHLLPGLVTP